MLTLPLTLKFKQTVKIGHTVVKCLRKDQILRNSSSLTYCVELVKKFDYENYLCNLLLPDNLKASAFAIRAFNVEVSRITGQVTEANIMPMRFKFWEDRVNDIYNDKTINHPVVQELLKAVKRHKLSKMFLRRLIAIRSKQLDRSTFKDMKEMELYADQTNSPIYMLLLEASGIKDINCDHAASHLGTAQGVANLIRGLRHNISERLIMLPMSLLAEYNVSEESLLRMQVNDSVLADIVFEVGKVASRHLNVVMSLEQKIPSQCRTIFLPAVAVKDYLKRLETSRFDVNDRKLSFSNGFLPLKLYISKLTKSI